MRTLAYFAVLMIRCRVLPVVLFGVLLVAGLVGCGLPGGSTSTTWVRSVMSGGTRWGGCTPPRPWLAI